MKVRAIKTGKIRPFEGDLHRRESSIFSVLDKYLKKVHEGSILAVTSKIVAISEGRVVLFSCSQCN